MNELLQERIRAGAKWLDANAEGWRDRVQVIDLKLENACTCVLGQVFTDDALALFHKDPMKHGRYRPITGYGETGTAYSPGYWYVLDRDFQGPELNHRSAAQLAFDYVECDPDYPYDWDDMTEAWKGYLKGEWT